MNFNILFIGDAGVGKTSILRRYANKKFDPNKMATNGVDFVLLKYIHEESKQECRVKIWDTAG